MAAVETQTDYGRRLLPVTIDEIAKTTPDRVWALKPASSALDGKYEQITFKTFANAINIMAWFIRENLGPSTNCETFVYLGKPDMRYHLMTMAAAKTGYKVLFSSHLNSLAAHLNLFRQTSCKTLLSASGVDVSDILGAEAMKHTIVPELDDLLTVTPAKHFAFAKTFDEAKHDPYLIIHTSGSTGLPKPISLNHAYVAALDAQWGLPDIDHQTGFHRQRVDEILKGPVLGPFAPFHGIASMFMLPLSVWGELIHVFGHPDRLMTQADVVHALKHLDLTAVFSPPYVLDGLVRANECLSELAKLSAVFYAGGVMPTTTAETLLSNGVQLRSYWGTSETGAMITGPLPPEDWEYLSFDPVYNGTEFRLASSDGSEVEESKQLYQLFMVRRPESEGYSMLFQARPEIDEWDVGDLWEKHPTKKHTWRYYGRADDLVCFANGLKLHPSDIENQLNGNRYVGSALLHGAGHLQVIALIELNGQGRELAEKSGTDAVKEDIWALVQRINQETQKIAQIDKGHIVLAREDKPFPRTSKGTPQRKAAVRAYEGEIEEAYQRNGDHAQDMMGRVAPNGVNGSHD